jgi:hypothetical protein
MLLSLQNFHKKIVRLGGAPRNKIAEKLELSIHELNIYELNIYELNIHELRIRVSL